MARTNLDRKRISKEVHEVAYIRRQARDLMKYGRAGERSYVCSEVHRVAKALLHYTKGYTAKKKH